MKNSLTEISNPNPAHQSPATDLKAKSMTTTPRELPGINIQWPWSEWIISGRKTIETRTYPIPQKHLGKPLALIETPGPRGRAQGIAKARIIGVVTFSESFQYMDKQHWAEDRPYHLVEASDDQFGFSTDKEKWGWRVAKIEKFEKYLPAPEKKGIVCASTRQIPSHLTL